MSMYRLLIAAALVITSAGVYLSRAQKGRSAADNQQPQTALLESHLLRLGEHYDVYFTLETAWGEGEFVNWMENHKVKEVLERDGLQRELERLRQSVPYFSYSFDLSNPKIVHIVDARLSQQGEYSLDRVVEKVNYKGTLRGLVALLAERGIKVAEGRLSLIGDLRPRDYSSEVRVVAQRITAREAITDFIPLEGRSRILWSSTTKLGPGEVTSIQFFGLTKR